MDTSSKFLIVPIYMFYYVYVDSFKIVYIYEQ